MSLFRLTLVAAVSTAAASQSASAAILVFNSKALYDTQVASLSQAIETFDTYSGNYTSPLVGITGGVTWSATSASGFTVSGGAMSTQMPGAMNIALSTADVRGVYGNFFGTDANGNLTPGLVFVSLANGTGSLLYVDNPNTFFGFYSTDSAITGISVSADAFPLGTPALRATVDNLGFSFTPIPAPGALALLGAAGVVGGLRRRR